MGLGDIVNKAKEALTGEGHDDLAGKASAGKDGLVDKAKEILTDERIDQAADAIKKVTPDSIDGKVDQIAEQAKKFND